MKSRIACAPAKVAFYRSDAVMYDYLLCKEVEWLRTIVNACPKECIYGGMYIGILNLKYSPILLKKSCKVFISDKEIYDRRCVAKYMYVGPCPLCSFYDSMISFRFAPNQ